MTVLHNFRRMALRLGLDVQRVADAAPRQLVNLLHAHAVDFVLDVGANQGQYGTMLRTFGYHGAICSFEPLPRAYEILARQSARHVDWSTHQLALGAENGVAALHVAGNTGGASSSILPMLPRHEQAAPDSGYVETIDVPIKRLDTIWNELVPPDATVLIKADVQGFEREVLAGAVDSLKRAVGLQLEISLVPLYVGALTLSEVLDRTDQLGMRLVDVEEVFRDPRNHELLQIDGLFIRLTADRTAGLS